MFVCKALGFGATSWPVARTSQRGGHTEGCRGSVLAGDGSDILDSCLRCSQGVPPRQDGIRLPAGLARAWGRLGPGGELGVWLGGTAPHWRAPPPVNQAEYLPSQIAAYTSSQYFEVLESGLNSYLCWDANSEWAGSVVGGVGLGGGCQLGPGYTTATQDPQEDQSDLPSAF